MKNLYEKMNEIRTETVRADLKEGALEVDYRHEFRDPVFPETEEIRLSLTAEETARFFAAAGIDARLGDRDKLDALKKRFHGKYALAEIENFCLSEGIETVKRVEKG